MNFFLNYRSYFISFRVVRLNETNELKKRVNLPPDRQIHTKRIKYTIAPFRSYV